MNRDIKDIRTKDGPKKSNFNAKQKVELAESLFEFAYKIKSFQLKRKYPALSAVEIHFKTIDLIANGCR